MMARNSQYRGGRGTNPSVFARGEAVRAAPTATMTVLENLQMGAYTRSDKASIAADIDKVLAFFPALKERVRQKAGTCSTGEQQMVAMGRALMLRPKLLLADEPSLGLSPNYVELVFDKLVEINKGGTSVLLVEQNASEALSIAHRAMCLVLARLFSAAAARNCCVTMMSRRLFWVVKNGLLTWGFAGWR
jgi:branched-chain amino acid transport system ATP-binding protein